MSHMGETQRSISHCESHCGRKSGTKRRDFPLAPRRIKSKNAINRNIRGDSAGIHAERTPDYAPFRERNTPRAPTQRGRVARWGANGAEFSESLSNLAFRYYLLYLGVIPDGRYKGRFRNLSTLPRIRLHRDAAYGIKVRFRERSLYAQPVFNLAGRLLVGKSAP